jgi:hypothetical protein
VIIARMSFGTDNADRRAVPRMEWTSTAESRHYVAASPGGGKSHLAAAIGLALVENGWRVLFTRTTDLVQKLQVARRELALEAAITRSARRGRTTILASGLETICSNSWWTRAPG